MIFPFFNVNSLSSNFRFLKYSKPSVQNIVCLPLFMNDLQDIISVSINYSRILEIQSVLNTQH